MGSLANLLMRTLLNVTIKVNNIVVKYKTPTTVATLTCESLHVTTADDLHLKNSKVGQATLSASVPDCRTIAGTCMRGSPQVSGDMRYFICFSRTQGIGSRRMQSSRASVSR